MKIRIYNEPAGGAMGGCEVYVAVLADALGAEGHEVEILHHHSALTRERLARFASVELRNVRCRLIPAPEIIRGSAWESWRRYREEKKQEMLWSADCDLFISFDHEILPFCAAPLGVLVVLFPFYDPARFVDDWLGSSPRDALRARVRSVWHKWKLRRRLRNYQVKTAISEFSRKWTKHRWGVDSELLYPPVEIETQLAAKSNRIVSVGRFATGRHSKNQRELLEVFGRLKRGRNDWHYECVGASGSSAVEVAFLSEMRQLADKMGAEVTSNIDRAGLASLYRETKIFWHAAGMNSNEETHPELAEHFGITTVEAMSAGCVPVVINKGGQPEIVEHGVSGFVWNTTDELQEYTTRLMQDETLWVRMSAAARLRAQKFSRQGFLDRFKQLMAPHLELSFDPALNAETLVTR